MSVWAHILPACVSFTLMEGSKGSVLPFKAWPFMQPGNQGENKKRTNALALRNHLVILEDGTS